MDEYITLKKDDLFKTLYLIEKILHIVHRAFSREDLDNSAYSLAIAFAEQNIDRYVNSFRWVLYDYLSEKEMEDLENMMHDIDEVRLVYGLSLEELRAKYEAVQIARYEQSVNFWIVSAWNPIQC